MMTRMMRTRMRVIEVEVESLLSEAYLCDIAQRSSSSTYLAQQADSILSSSALLRQ